jgi:hypothetical protein
MPVEAHRVQRDERPTVQGVAEPDFRQRFCSTSSEIGRWTRGRTPEQFIGNAKMWDRSPQKSVATTRGRDSLGVAQRTAPHCLAGLRSAPFSICWDRAYIANGQFPCSSRGRGSQMPVESYVYECNRCGERIEAPRPIFDKSLCPQASPSGARCLGHLERIDPDAAISAGRADQRERHFKGNDRERARTQHPSVPSRWKPSLN